MNKETAHRFPPTKRGPMYFSYPNRKTLGYLQQAFSRARDIDIQISDKIINGNAEWL
jgi:hypothetical protein